MQSGRAKGFVSARKVAELAGVSRSAVSRTFTEGASVSEETRAKVLAAAGQLGYHVNHLARGLIHEQSNIVSIIAADIRNPYQSRLIDEITASLQHRGRVTMLINTDGDDRAAATALARSLNYRADAAIVLSGTPPAALVDTCLANGQHVVLINRAETPPGADRILIDNAGAAETALQMALRAGCRRHLVVASGSRTASLVERGNAYLAAARAAGVGVELIVAGPTSYASGLEAARRVLAKGPPPDAAFCVNDLLALGFMDGARQDFGLRIPEDLCVTGFDDIEQAGWQSYGLTTFRQPYAAMAERIAALVSAPRDDADPGRTIALAAELILRRSLRPGAGPEGN